jgi:hypothetical protein
MRPMSRRLQILLAIVGCAGVLALVDGGAAAAARGTATPAAVVRVHAVAHPATAAAVLKFLAHAGAAYYVFEHFIWKPYKAGDLHGFTHVFTIAKAGLAALFVYHELKVMAGDVKGSKLLSFLAAPIALAVAKLSSLKSAISGGKLTAIAGVQSDLGSISQKAGSKGFVIKEIEHAL